ncbi:MAG TPA: glycosyltransferase family 39 protein [Gemmatimonadales bacterium]|jgi:hypothetical protein|nr:glycosyltransferase family 39 protein [Gemmatimonadales bacterium]
MAPPPPQEGKIGATFGAPERRADDQVAVPIPDPSHRVVTFCLLVCVGFGGLLRLHHLDQFSLWDDEARTFLVSSIRNPVALVKAIPWFTPANPPLDLLLRSAVMAVIGRTTYAFTLTSVLLSTAGLVCWYAFLSRVIERRAALVAVAILAFHPVSVFYAQTGRNYAIMDVIVPLACLLLITAWQRGGVARWSAYSAMLAAAFHAHLLLSSLWFMHGVVVLVVVAVTPLPDRRRLFKEKLVPFAGALALAGVLCIPWAGFTWFGLRVNPLTGHGYIYDTLRQVLKASMPGSGTGARILALLAAAGFARFSLAAPWRGVALLSAWAVGYAIAYGLTHRNFFVFRYVYFLFPAIVACLALGVCWMADVLGRGADRLFGHEGRSRPVAAIALLLGLFAIGVASWPRLAQHYAHGIEYDGDWRTAVRYVERRAGSRDWIVVPHAFHANYAVYATKDFLGAVDHQYPVSLHTEPWIFLVRRVHYRVLEESRPQDGDSIAKPVGRVFVIAMHPEADRGMPEILQSPSLTAVVGDRSLKIVHFRGIEVLEFASTSESSGPGLTAGKPLPRPTAPRP